MKYILICFLSIGSTELLTAQIRYVSALDSISQNIAKLELLMESKNRDSTFDMTLFALIKSTKEYSDHYYYTNLREIALRETDKEKRIMIFKEISLYPYYLIKNSSIHYYAGELYSGSILQLIREYSGNVELLKTIKIHPSYSQLINPSLKRAIEVAGGEWDRE